MHMTSMGHMTIISSVTESAVSECVVRHKYTQMGHADDSPGTVHSR